MPKNRLSELKKAQKENDNNSAIVQVADESPADNDMKRIFDRAEVIRQWTEQMETNLEHIAGYLDRYEDMGNDQKSVLDRLNALFENNKSISKQISSKLKEIQMEIEANSSKLSNAQSRIVNIQYQTASTRFKKAFVENGRKLDEFCAIQKRQIRGQLMAKGSEVTDEELTALMDEGKDLQLFTENILRDTAEAKQVLRDVEERHQQLLKIERMIVEVHDLFVQIAFLVEDQQELLDRIEYQADIALEAVQKGRKDMQNAERSKTKYRKLKIIIASIVVVVLTVLIVGLVR